MNERIEVIVHLNGRKVDSRWRLTRETFSHFGEDFWAKSTLAEHVDKDGSRLTNDNLSVTVYP